MGNTILDWDERAIFMEELKFFILVETQVSDRNGFINRVGGEQLADGYFYDLIRWITA